MKKIFMILLIMIICITPVRALQIDVLDGDETPNEIADRINQVIEYINKLECQPARCKSYAQIAEEYRVKYNESDDEYMKDLYFEVYTVFSSNAQTCRDKCEK